MPTLLDSYQTYFRDLHPILKGMANRGIPIDGARREELRALITRKDAEVTAKIQSIVPAEVLSTKQKNGYKNPPLLECEECHLKTREDHICGVGPADSLFTAEGELLPYADLAESHGLVLREVTISGNAEKCRCSAKARPYCSTCHGTGIIPAGTVEMRWVQPVEFNPNSRPQVIRFMKYLKHPVPKSAKKVDDNGDPADTTDVKDLERLYVKTKHPIYPLLIEKRQMTKMMGTYVDGWAPGKDGRIHTTYTFQTATWQLSSRAPNLQNGIKRSRSEGQRARSELFNRMQRAEPGHILVNLDFKSFHAQTTACEAGLPDYLRLAKIDIHSFIACHFLKLPERFDLLKWSDADLKAFLGGLKKDKQTKFHGMNFSEIRSKSKACIAEGEMVWTNHGSKPIQNVTIDDQLWDGVEWVHHEGIIYKGEREVITYDGLTATPDHKVYTEDERTIPFGQAASELVRLKRSRVEGNAVWNDRNYQLETNPQERIHSCQNSLLDLRPCGNSRLHVSEVRTWNRMPELRPQEANQEPLSKNFRTALRCNSIAMLESTESGLLELWRQGNKMSIQLPQWIRAICGKKLAARFIPWNRNRQDQQQWKLRTGKFAPSDSQDANGQSKNYSMGNIEERPRTTGRLGFAVSNKFDAKIGTTGIDRRTDHCARPNSCLQGQSKNVEETSPVAHKARVYDLINAGSRHRFTVNGRLVANCSLGIGFGMGPRKLYQQYKEDFENQHEAEALHGMIMHDLFPGLLKWQIAVKARAAEDHQLISRFGAIRHFYDVQRWDRRTQKMAGGDQAEAAIAFLPAANAFGMIRWAMLNLQKAGLCERYGLINTIHDSLVLHPLIEEADDAIAAYLSIMQAPCPMMVYAGVTGPEGLSVEVEAAKGDCLAEAK